MKTCLCFMFLLLFPLISFSQQKGYVSVAFGKDFPKHYHVIGGNVTVNRPVSNGFYLGLGSAFLKFDNVENFYFPVFANLSFLKQKPGKKIFPVAFIQPGYGFYKHEESGV